MLLPKRNDKDLAFLDKPSQQCLAGRTQPAAKHDACFNQRGRADANRGGSLEMDRQIRSLWLIPDEGNNR